MSQSKNTLEPGYGSVAKALHWIIVLLLIVQYAIAWTIPEIHQGTRPEGLISAHLSLGLVILALTVLRLLWRNVHPMPLIGKAMPAWQYAERRSSMRCSICCSCR